MTKRLAEARREEAPDRKPSKRTPTIGSLAGLDDLLDVRERLVMILDAIDQDDVDTARFYAQGLLDDFDSAVRS